MIKMASKPKVYKSIIGNCFGLNIELYFDCNITMLYGDSGTGKTMLAQIFSTMTSKYRIKVFDYRDSFSTKQDVTKFLKTSRGYFVVIDNADILLDKEDRQSICLNDSNQYLIIGRQPKGLLLNKNNFKELEIANNTIHFSNIF